MSFMSLLLRTNTSTTFLKFGVINMSPVMSKSTIPKPVPMNIWDQNIDTLRQNRVERSIPESISRANFTPQVFEL
jgi:hypothetical protein